MLNEDVFFLEQKNSQNIFDLIFFHLTDLGSHVNSFVVVAVVFGAVPLLFAYPVPLFGVEPAAVATAEDDPAAPLSAPADDIPPLPLDARLGGIFDTTVDPYTRIASSFSSSNASWMENRGCFIFGVCVCVCVYATEWVSVTVCLFIKFSLFNLNLF